MGLIFVTGGAKSGKSKFAEEMLLKLNNGKQKNIYLATSLIFDEEMKEKIRLHKKRRKNDWFTVETYKNFENELNNFFENNDKTKNNMLVDCLTNMITNIIFENKNIDWDNFEKKMYIQTLEKLNKNVENSVNKLLNVTNEFENVIIVSNELGMGLVPSYPLGRYFREIAGKMNQIVAEKADEVYFVVSGISMKIK
ncbi:bifunctional adenosylcobinamide kinase/adenosylcobinamide-phosphate guanylyltransferase [Leptotrichia wadei]|jgi:adenosylcobalamin biosynthesis protein cobU|uniref:Adenosylcobinamide kinase n=1 Tax=Leptotrichia wadei TaxID=157687 RepID=A0A510KD65_9FUSO|nr:bifunctional adenosylcobinamide kinase/adenosylcobinamide-phosphate guanylyltransferase [Leptotrichia wadei]BBM49117.1 cobalbumin biosynthesis protein [Leptotrichia wadei]